MRSLRTDAERAEAVALVEDRLGWLTRHGLPKPAGADIPELFWSKELRTVGLFEDGLLLACMILGLEAGSGREGSAETGSRLLLHHVYTLPEHPDDIVRLITLWSSDYAARLDRPGVRAETYAPREPNTGPTRRFLDRLQEMGWTVTGTAALFGEHVIRLELRAEARPPLLLLIRCEVPLPLPASSDSKGRTS
ncbi:hypothetical protein [Streptomyces aureus]|uniref:hypothetical protein n=1 Tax=Streptomyces aureus TaxID=193461 RepID=UPI00055A8915|nr:hypothetical protein [Streptomyces aureus]